MWDFWNSDGPATLIFQKDGRETVINFWVESMALNISAPPLQLTSKMTGLWREPSYREATFDLKGMVDTMVWDAEIRYLKEKFTQKRIDIVNIDPALKWQPKGKIA